MFRRQRLSDLPTAVLAISYVANRKALERCRTGGSIWKKLLRRMLRLKPNTRKLRQEELRLQSLSALYARELQVRFDGILRELLERTVQPERPSEDDLREFLCSVWLVVEGLAASLRDAETFFVFFWSQIELVLQTRSDLQQLTPAVVALKPKFMLRPFIDDIRSPDQRRTLCALAYDASVVEVRSDRQQLDILESAYRSLHAVLWARRDQLSRRTGSEIVVDEKTPIIATLARYERWLFLR
jgi:hypothetical protein